MINFIKKPPVQMVREMQSTVDDPKEVHLARKSVAESMARLFPMHTYSHEEVEIHGKLRVVNFTYRYSLLRDLRYRLTLFLARYRQGSSFGPS